MYDIKLAGNLSLSVNNNNLTYEKRTNNSPWISEAITSVGMSWFWAQRGAFVRCMNLLYARMSWLHREAEIRVVNISIDLLAVRSWRHPVVTSGYILGLPGNATSSANANVVEHYHVLFKNVFTSAFYCENLAFPKICVHLWIHVTLRQTNNELVLSPLIDVIKDWFHPPSNPRVN